MFKTTNQMEIALWLMIAKLSSFPDFQLPEGEGGALPGLKLVPTNVDNPIFRHVQTSTGWFKLPICLLNIAMENDPL